MSEVTIGISFYNDESILHHTIDSVLNQTFEDWNLLLINDGSTDRSVEIAKQYESSRVKIIDDNENKGLIHRLNQLIEMTDTVYFVRMDSDDIMAPDRLEKQIGLLKKQTELDLVGSAAYIIDENNQITGKRLPLLDIKNRDDVLRKGLFIHPTVTGKTSWFQRHKYKKGFNRAEDLELWCRTYNRTRFVVMDEPLLFYRDPMEMNLQKYKDSSRTVRKIIRLYASNNRIKLKLLVREQVKIGIYMILEKLKYTGVANNRRNKALQVWEEEKAHIVLSESIKHHHFFERNAEQCEGVEELGCLSEYKLYNV